MAKPQISPVNFTDGCVGDANTRIWVACDLQAGDFNLTRLCMWKGGTEWYKVDFESVVVSVCLLLQTRKPERTYYSLGQDGRIHRMESGVGVNTETIPEAGTGPGKYGYLSQIREIGGEIFCCGDQGQVYRRSAKGWNHMDDGLLHKESRKKDTTLNGMDGTSPEDLYAVGDHGKIFHFNGKKWTDVSFATNYPLERVRCVSPDEVYVCGDHGIVLKGNRKGWKNIGDPELESIWDIQPFEGKLYLAAEETLTVYDGKTYEPVEHCLDREIDAHRLAAGNGELWSFGEEHLAWFDGKNWSYLQHPDNV